MEAPLLGILFVLLSQKVQPMQHHRALYGKVVSINDPPASTQRATWLRQHVPSAGWAA